MHVKKYRWSKVYESSEEELVDFLESRSIAARRWELVEFKESEPQTTLQQTMLWCAEGSLSFIYDGTAVSVQPGDTLQIPEGVTYRIRAGMSGCVCYQA